MGMIGWQTKAVLQLSIRIVLTSSFSYDAHCYFGVNENVKFAIPNDTKTILPSQNPKPSSHLKTLHLKHNRKS
jgi:hypothetical protein